MTKRFNPAPGWPSAPADWLPYDGWEPDASWPPAPEGWNFVIDDSDEPREPKLARKVLQAGQELQARRVAKQNAAMQGSDVLWSTRGQPVTGIGGGRYWLTATTLFFEKGMLTTSAQQIPTNQLFDIDMRKSMTQKARGVGDVIVHVHRPTGTEIVVLSDIADAREAVTVINRVAHDARLTATRISNTHHYSAAEQSDPAPQGATTTDPIEQLTRLGQLRDAGVLTTEEFEAKKIEILARM